MCLPNLGIPHFSVADRGGVAGYLINFESCSKLTRHVSLFLDNACEANVIKLVVFSLSLTS